ncbi:hypothetical protein PODOV087v1_p0015 [Vibrio phage 431E45.1]|nr:hypothetical protein PODOV087v1_p0015 [Vibrio phage 431E45.1]
MIKFESEKHLEDFIFGEFKNNFECIITGEVFNNCKRQLHIGAYGIPDLVFYSCDNDEIEGGTPIVYRKIHVI